LLFDYENKKQRKNKKEKRNIRHREYVFEKKIAKRTSPKTKKKERKKRVSHIHWRHLLARKK
jgi:hypothetical protein